MIVRALATLMMLACGVAAAEPVVFGARTLDIPVPEGFVPSAKDVPTFLELSQGFLPAQNRLVEIYIDPTDKAAFLFGQAHHPAPRMERYFQLQVPRRVDGKPISHGDFVAASESMAAELEKAFGEIDGIASDLADQGGRTIQEKTGEQVELEVGAIRYLGPFRREPWGLFFTVASDVQVGGADGDTSHSGPMISAGALALINHQIVLLYAYADGDDDATRRATEAALSEWVDRVRGANPDDPEVARQVSRSGFDLGSIGRGALIGALCGGLIGLLAWFRRRRDP